MITPSFNLTATERVLPKLALDFTTASLDSRITFTRTGNTATVTNSSGYVVPINADLPRFDYNPITLTCKGLLIEEQRTNLSTYSEDFSNASWTLKNQITIETNVLVAPDGALAADKMVTNTNSAEHSILFARAVTSGVTYTQSYYVKNGGTNFFYIAWQTSSFGAFSPTYFNLTTGEITLGSGSTATITNVGNGWYRCTATRAAVATMIADLRIGLTNSNTSTTSTGANATDGIYIWGGQFEIGAFATSYVPTEALAVTRNADVATMTGANFSDWFNASEGTFTGQGALLPNSPSGILLCPNNGGVAERFRLLLGTTGGAWLVSAGGSTVAGIGVRTLSGKTTGSYKLNNFTVATNGADYATDGSGAVPTGLDRMVIGSETAGSPTFLNGWVQKIMYYPQQLTPNEIVAFSK
jgi:hypothetical protein